MGILNFEDSANGLNSRIVFTPEESLFKMPEIKLNFWSKEEAPKEPPKKRLKNEVLILVYKKLKGHKKMAFSEGNGNYARFF